MTRKILSIAFLLGACLPTVTTRAEKAGTWTLYKSFSNITEISPAGNQCFALASGSLFGYNTASGELTVYDKTNILSDNNIRHIQWNATAKRLVIAYDNGNIDLLATDGTTTNVPDLYMKDTSKDKTINHIFIDGSYAYISTGLGILKLDTKRGVIPDTYQFDFGIDYSYTDGGYVYAASRSHGLYRGKQTDNLLDQGNWQRVGDYTWPTEDRTNVKDPTTNLWWTRGDNGKLTYYTLDESGTRTYKTEGVLPDGPASNHFYKLYTNGGKLYCVGGFWEQAGDQSYTGEVHVWNGTSWTEFEQPSEETIGHFYQDLLCLDFDPKKEGHVMVGAKGGIYEFQDGKFVRDYGLANSPLESNINNKDYTIVSSLKYDASGNLWILNREADKPIKMLSSTGEWHEYAQPELDNEDYKWNLTSMFISPTNGYMWFVNNYYTATRLYAYDYTADKLYTLGGPSYTNEDGTQLTPEYLYSTSEDANGNIWFATSLGPLYLEPSNSQSSVFTQHKVPRNDGTNLADYLLSNVNTRRVAFDGANRKWVATNDNGVFLISEDCNTQIEHFTTENSPLPSNTLFDVVADPNSNTIYFATSNGLCSYASDATQPSDNMTKDNVYAYPNPVTPDYTGNVTIVGLSLNADVKIVTSNGVLVNQGRSTGGSYHWDCRDRKGKRVASGIYMVEIAKSDGAKGTVCKIAVIN